MKILALLIAVWAILADAQEYDDYAQPDYSQDNLYHDYAARQQEKEVPKAGPAWGTLMAGGAVGWLIGAKFHTSKLAKKLNQKHKDEQKALYKQYYTDVYTLQQQNAELVAALEQYGVKMR